MEEQLNFIQTQIDRANSNLDNIRTFLRYGAQSGNEDTQIVAQMLSEFTSVVSSQQALIESMFNLLKAKIN